MCHRHFVTAVLLVALATLSSAQLAQRVYTGSIITTYSSAVSVSVYCGDSIVLSTMLYGSETSNTYASLQYSYPDCAARLSNNIDEPFTISVYDYYATYSTPQNTTVQESSFLGYAFGSSGNDFYPNTPKNIALIPGSVTGTTERYYNFTIAVIGSFCGDRVRQAEMGEECDAWSNGCDENTCTCEYGYYVDTRDTTNTYCMYSPYDTYDTSVPWLGVFLGIVIPVFVVIIVLSVVLRVLFIRGVIQCCGVRRPRNIVSTVNVVQTGPVATTTTTTAVVQGQQPGVTQVPYYPQPQQPQQQYSPQQYPVQQPVFVPQQGHVVPPPQQQQQHVMQYPAQQPNVDGPVVPPQQYSQPMMQQQPYAPQAYPDQQVQYGYPGGNVPVQGGYVVYSPPPQNNAFQSPEQEPK